MPRIRLYDFRNSTGPSTLGICSDDAPSCAAYVNSAQRRLILAREAGDEGWWGTWSEVAFLNVSRANPYITCGPEIARIERIDVCNRPVPINNQFKEYLEFGNGRMPNLPNFSDWWPMSQAFTRDNAITFVDQTIVPCYLRVYASDPADIQSAKRVLLQGVDSSDNVIYSQDGLVQVQGVFVTLQSPFTQSPMTISAITGIQKDITAGPIQVFQVDPSTGDQTLLLIMQPWETVAGYRRYYLNDLPTSCCLWTSTTTQPLFTTAIVKLELVPVKVDTDYLLLQNLEAVIEECIAIRMSRMDNAQAQQLAAVHHVNAIRMLNSEITHYLGKQSPAVNFSPFGSAKLQCQQIGSMI